MSQGPLSQQAQLALIALWGTAGNDGNLAHHNWHVHPQSILEHVTKLYHVIMSTSAANFLCLRCDLMPTKWDHNDSLLCQLLEDFPMLALSDWSFKKIAWLDPAHLAGDQRNATLGEVVIDALQLLGSIVTHAHCLNKPLHIPHNHAQPLQLTSQSSLLQCVTSACCTRLYTNEQTAGRVHCSLGQSWFESWVKNQMKAGSF